MTQAASQAAEPKPVKSPEILPEQEAVVGAIVQIFQRYLPSPVPQVETAKPDPQFIGVERASVLTGISIKRLIRMGRAKRFFYFIDGPAGPKVKLADMLTFDPEWLLNLPPIRGGTQYAAARKKR